MGSSSKAAALHSGEESSTFLSALSRKSLQEHLVQRNFDESTLPQKCNGRRAHHRRIDRNWSRPTHNQHWWCWWEDILKFCCWEVRGYLFGVFLHVSLIWGSFCKVLIEKRVLRQNRHKTKKQPWKHHVLTPRRQSSHSCSHSQTTSDVLTTLLMSLSVS